MYEPGSSDSLMVVSWESPQPGLHSRPMPAPWLRVGAFQCKRLALCERQQILQVLQQKLKKKKWIYTFPCLKGVTGLSRSRHSFVCLFPSPKQGNLSLLYVNSTRPSPTGLQRPSSPVFFHLAHRDVHLEVGVLKVGNIH